MIEHVHKAIQKSLVDNLPKEVYAIEGMSSNKVRNLLNNICNLKDFNYLEVGCWKGSTAIASLYGNEFRKAYLVDNWSQFGDVRNEFKKNIKLITGNIQIIEDDCFSVYLPDMDSIDVFFFDGLHTYEDQNKALKYYYQILKNKFIYIVDDTNEPEVINGTLDAIKELGLNINYMSILPSRYNCDTDFYWNGIGVFILSK